MESQKPKIVVLVGPTASGKTALAIELAKQCSGEVISADSRQVYKKLDIGTEKITKDEMDGVPHHLIDIVDTQTTYSASDFKRDAASAIEEITSRGKLPIIAGGTFFYINVLLEKIVSPEVPPNQELRAELEEKSASDLFAALQNIDPRRAADVDPENKRRLIRALEIVRALGKVPEAAEKECPYDVIMIGIETDRTILRERIAKRSKEALSRGLATETKELLESRISKERLSEIGLEYRIVLEHLDGLLTEEALIKKLEEKVWQYAKRQLTWLKREETVHWFQRTQTSEIKSSVELFLQK
ncbi:MAG: tRNA dimethylallyltransferase [Candidatus Azotimanducaceae bacterium]|jgi:tRNA dimethylallyltransferase